MGKIYTKKLRFIACFFFVCLISVSVQAQQAQETKEEKKEHKHRKLFGRKESDREENDRDSVEEKERARLLSNGKALTADEYEELEQQNERNVYAHTHSSWYKESLKKKPNVNKAENAYSKYFSTHKESSSVKTRFETWVQQARLYKDKRGYLTEYPAFLSPVAPDAFTPGVSSANNIFGTWTMIGVANMNRAQPCNNSSLVTGGFCDRVYVNPYNTQNLFAGFGYGGLWVSTDQGANWSLTDGSFANGSNTYANRDYYYGEIEANKLNSSLVFAATEAGLLKSTNGGVNWLMCPTLNRSATSTSRPYYVAMATDVQTVVLSTFGKKIYRSGDGGSTWSMVFDNSAGGASTHFPAGGTYNKGTPFGLDDRWYNFFGLEADYSDSNHFYLGAWNSSSQACIYESKDKGLTFTLLVNLNTTLGTTWGATTMLSLKTIPSNAAKFFVYEGYVTGKPCYKFSSAGALLSSTLINSYPEAFDFDWNNENTMYEGQYGVYNATSGFSKSTDGGATFVSPFNSSTCNYLHSDIRGVSAVGNVVLIGNDGGLGLSTDGGITVNGTGYEINSMDMWGFASSNKSDICLTGLDHNQTFVRTSAANGGWQAIKGADAGVCSINPVDDRWLYYDWAYGINKGYLNVNNTVTESSVAPGINLGSLQFHPYMLYNIFGLQKASTADTIYQSADNMTTATKIFATFTKKVTSFYIARRDPKTMYVLLNQVNIKKTTDSGATWVDVTPSSVASNGQTNITAIEVGKTPGELWAVYGNAQNTTKVLYSTNGGSTWTNITTPNLPAIAVNDIAYQRGTNGGVYIMTITASGTLIWYKNNNMAQWQQVGSNLPLMGYLRNRLFVVPFKNKIRFGSSRGAYENDLYEQSGVEAGLAVDKATIQPHDTVSYYNSSAYAPGAAAFQWQFPGGVPATSTLENPKVSYALSGIYPATLIVTTATGADTITVNNLINVKPAPPTVSVTSPANDAAYSAGSTIAITATASSPNPNGSIAKIDFYAGNTLLGSDTTAPYSFDWSNVPGGVYNLTAIATDNIGLKTTSAAVTNVQVGVTTKEPVADAYIRNGTSGNSNFGTATVLTVKSDAVSFMREAYVKFNFNSYTGPVDGAKLRLYAGTVNTDPTRVVSIYGIADTTWGETTITFNNQPAEAGTLLGKDTVTNVNGVWYQLDVTTYIKNQLAAGHKTVSFRLINNGAAAGGSDVSFNSREAANNHPQLLVIQSQPLPPTVTVTAPENNATVVAGSNIIINATANTANAGGSVANVKLYNGSTSLGTFATAPYTYTLHNVIPGKDTLTAVVTDNIGLTATSAAVIVTVKDTTAPVIQTAAGSLNTMVQCSDATGIAAALNQQPTATDDYTVNPVIHLISDSTTTACGNTYTRTRTWNFTDDAGNVSNAFVQTITVKDTIAPVIAGKTDASRSANPGVCTYTTAGNEFDITATDNCTTVSLGYTLSGATSGSGNSSLQGITFNTGVTTVNWTATDACGNASTNTFNVTVTDNENPTITAPANINTNTDLNQAIATVAIGTATTADNCGVASVTNDAPAVFPVGATTVTWTVTDVHGNTTTATQTVTVMDSEAPIITQPAAINSNNDEGTCGATIALTAPVVTDNTGVASITNDAPAIFPVGTTTVTWTATDLYGNIATVTQTVTVTDNENPTIIAPVNINANTDLNQSTATVTIGAATTTDNCGVASVTNNAPVTFPVGTTTVTWTVTDVHGNTSTATQTIIVSDNQSPVITQPTVINANNDAGTCGASLVLVTPATSDNTAVASVTNNAPAVFPVGTTTVTWTVTDIYSNTASTTQQVTVTDSEVPAAITRPVTITLANGTASINAAAVNNGSTDNCGIASISVSPSAFTNSNIGNNTVTLTVTDIHGNTANGTAVVTVKAENNLIVSIAAIPASNVYTGGVPTDIYLGYGPQSVTLNAIATDGAPYTYAWGGNATLSSTSSSSPVFTPTAAGYYTFTVQVTNVYGYTASSSISICVRDIRVPNSNGKIYLTHEGGTISINTLSISVNAVPDHLTNHPGDHLGAVNMQPCTTTTSMMTVSKSAITTKEEGKHVDELTIGVNPNPSASVFKLEVWSNKNDKVKIEIADISGRILKSMEVNAGTTLQFGADLRTGTYFVTVKQGANRKVVKLIKL